MRRATEFSWLSVAAWCVMSGTVLLIVTAKAGFAPSEGILRALEDDPEAKAGFMAVFLAAVARSAWDTVRRIFPELWMLLLEKATVSISMPTEREDGQLHEGALRFMESAEPIVRGFHTDFSRNRFGAFERRPRTARCLIRFDGRPIFCAVTHDGIRFRMFPPDNGTTARLMAAVEEHSKHKGDDEANIVEEEGVQLETLNVYQSDGMRNPDWDFVGDCYKLPGRFVILSDTVRKRTIDDLRSFLKRRPTYLRLGIPYRRGYLLYGRPGCGKTSIAKAMASECDLALYSICLSDEHLTDRGLLRLMQMADKPSLLLLEDIDAVFTMRDRTEVADETNKVSFAGVLNAIDGAASAHDLIIVMTTNHPEKLDPALTRPGRADVCIEVGLATRRQASEMFLKFFPDGDESETASYRHVDLAATFADQVPPDELSMARIQSHLMLHWDDPESASSTVAEMIAEDERERELRTRLPDLSTKT